MTRDLTLLDADSSIRCQMLRDLNDAEGPCDTRDVTIERLDQSQNAVVSRGQKNTGRMLKALLGALGFGCVEAVFAEQHKT